MISSSERYNAHPSIISESSTDKKKELWAPRFTQRVEFFFIIILLSSGSLVKAVFRVFQQFSGLCNDEKPSDMFVTKLLFKHFYTHFIGDSTSS